MDHYEHRSWPAWHRHMTYVFLALHLLLRLRLRFKKNTDADTAAGADVAHCNIAVQALDASARAGSCEILYEKKSCGISITQKKAIN